MTSPSRAAFEKWASDRGHPIERHPLDFGPFKEGDYVRSSTATHWAAFQAGHEACAESLSSKPGAWAREAATEISRAFYRDPSKCSGFPGNIDDLAATIMRHAPASYDDGWKAGILAAVTIIEDHRRDAPETIASIGLKQTLIAAIRALLAPAGGEGGR